MRRVSRAIGAGQPSTRRHDCEANGRLEPAETLSFSAIGKVWEENLDPPKGATKPVTLHGTYSLFPPILPFQVSFFVKTVCCSLPFLYLSQFQWKAQPYPGGWSKVERSAPPVTAVPLMRRLFPRQADFGLGAIGAVRVRGAGASINARSAPALLESGIGRRCGQRLPARPLRGAAWWLRGGCGRDV